MRETSFNSGEHYRPGDAYGICDECGFSYRHSELRRRWDNALVCSKDWEPQHPQEFVRGRADQIAVYNARPETFVAVLNDDCSADTGWTLGDGWTLDEGANEFDHSADVNVLDRAVTGLISGGSYLLQITTVNRTAGSVVVSLLTAADEAGDLTITEDGQSNIIFTAAAATDTIRFTPSADFNGSIKWVAIYPKAAPVTQESL